MVKLRIIIDDAAGQSLKEAYNYIKKDSLQNAQKVVSEIRDSFKQLAEKPLLHAPDKYRLDKNPSFRAYEIHKYRISYHVGDSEIRIIRIRHTKMNPLDY
ncbi:MAG: type II toxin-antitoxin system RelE/ParE family toxin [Chitinophagaceae bacterium]|nr:type II toxin-antitoxin system RelE/ParE family toxin [Chitinophagaceae bacterium]